MSKLIRHRSLSHQSAIQTFQMACYITGCPKQETRSIWKSVSEHFIFFGSCPCI